MVDIKEAVNKEGLPGGFVIIAVLEKARDGERHTGVLEDQISEGVALLLSQQSSIWAVGGVPAFHYLSIIDHPRVIVGQKRSIISRNYKVYNINTTNEYII